MAVVASLLGVEDCSVVVGVAPAAVRLPALRRLVVASALREAASLGGSSWPSAPNCWRWGDGEPAFGAAAEEATASEATSPEAAVGAAVAVAPVSEAASSGGCSPPSKSDCWVELGGWPDWVERREGDEEADA